MGKKKVDYLAHFQKRYTVVEEAMDVCAEFMQTSAGLTKPKSAFISARLYDNGDIGFGSHASYEDALEENGEGRPGIVLAVNGPDPRCQEFGDLPAAFLRVVESLDAGVNFRFIPKNVLDSMQNKKDTQPAMYKMAKDFAEQLVAGKGDRHMLGLFLHVCERMLQTQDLNRFRSYALMGYAEGKALRATLDSGVEIDDLPIAYIKEALRNGVSFNEQERNFVVDSYRRETILDYQRNLFEVQNTVHAPTLEDQAEESSERLLAILIDLSHDIDTGVEVEEAQDLINSGIKLEAVHWTVYSSSDFQDALYHALNRADFSIENKCALLSGCSVEQLEEYTDYGMTILHDIIEDGVNPHNDGDKELLVNAILSTGFDVNMPTETTGQTPLMIAAEIGDCNVVKMLVEHPLLNIHAIDAERGRTAMDRLLDKYDEEPIFRESAKSLACVLMDAGADAPVRQPGTASAELLEAACRDRKSKHLHCGPAL